MSALFSSIMFVLGLLAMDDYVDLDAIPGDFQVRKMAGVLEIFISQKRYFLPAAFSAIIPAIGFFVAFYKAVLEGVTVAHMEALLFLFFLFIVFGYVALIKRKNRTCVRVSSERIVISCRPLPWWGDQEIDARTLRQLFVAELKRADSDVAETLYEVRAVTTNGQNVALIDDLSDLNQALYIQNSIEKHLGLQLAKSC